MNLHNWSFENRPETNIGYFIHDATVGRLSGITAVKIKNIILLSYLYFDFLITKALPSS